MELLNTKAKYFFEPDPKTCLIVSEVRFALKFIVHDTCLDLKAMTKTFYLLRCNTQSRYLLQIVQDLSKHGQHKQLQKDLNVVYFNRQLFNAQIIPFAGLSIPFLDFSHHFDEKKKKIGAETSAKEGKTLSPNAGLEGSFGDFLGLVQVT